MRKEDRVRKEWVQQSLQYVTEAGIFIEVFNITLQAIQHYLYHLEVGCQHNEVQFNKTFWRRVGRNAIPLHLCREMLQKGVTGCTEGLPSSSAKIVLSSPWSQFILSSDIPSCLPKYPSISGLTLVVNAYKTRTSASNSSYFKDRHLKIGFICHVGVGQLSDTGFRMIPDTGFPGSTVNRW